MHVEKLDVFVVVQAEVHAFHLVVHLRANRPVGHVDV